MILGTLEKSYCILASWPKDDLIIKSDYAIIMYWKNGPIKLLYCKDVFTEGCVVIFFTVFMYHSVVV